MLVHDEDYLAWSGAVHRFLVEEGLYHLCFPAGSGGILSVEGGSPEFDGWYGDSVRVLCVINESIDPASPAARRIGQGMAPFPFSQFVWNRWLLNPLPDGT